MAARYTAKDGKIYANGKEVTTALTSNGRDLEKFEAALTTARKQRELKDRVK